MIQFSCQDTKKIGTKQLLLIINQNLPLIKFYIKNMIKNISVIEI